jgi:glyoxylase I family protein
MTQHLLLGISWTALFLATQRWSGETGGRAKPVVGRNRWSGETGGRPVNVPGSAERETGQARGAQTGGRPRRDRGGIVPELAYPPRNPASPLASSGGHHVAVRVDDYEAARNWYVDKLDFRFVREWSWAGMRFAYLVPPDDDTFHVEIMGGGTPRPKTAYTDVVESLQDTGYHHFCLHVASVDDTLAELRRRGVTTLGEPFDIPEINGRLVVIADPWGNMIELSQPLD